MGDISEKGPAGCEPVRNRKQAQPSQVSRSEQSVGKVLLTKQGIEDKQVQWSVNVRFLAPGRHPSRGARKKDDLAGNPDFGT